MIADIFGHVDRSGNEDRWFVQRPLLERRLPRKPRLHASITFANSILLTCHITCGQGSATIETNLGLDGQWDPPAGLNKKWQVVGNTQGLDWR